MARQPRLNLPGILQHLVQRGNDRQACFAAETDYLRYLQELREASANHDCAIHAYVLMTNYVHLLVTPATTGAISRMMQAVGRRYVGSFNARYRRTGTLWEGRFKAAPVDTDRYLLTCYRDIELNPVRAHMTDDPSTYPWSSYHHNALGQHTPLVTPHVQYTLWPAHLLRVRPTSAPWCTNRWKKNLSTISVSTPSNRAHGEANAFSGISRR